MPLLQPSQNSLTGPNMIRVCLRPFASIINALSTINVFGRTSTHAGKDNVTLGRLSFNQCRIIKGPEESLNADGCEQREFGGVANERSNLRRGAGTVLEKTLEDGAPDVT